MTVLLDARVFGDVFEDVFDGVFESFTGASPRRRSGT